MYIIPKDRPTGNTGVVELVTRASRFGANVADHRYPKPGEFVVRHLKKDGSESLKFTEAYYEFREPRKYTFRGWYPEGVDPNTKEAK